MGLLGRFSTKDAVVAGEWLEKAEAASVRIQISDEDITRQLKMIDFKESDLKLIKTLQPLVKERADEIVDHFYGKLLQFPELEFFIDEHSTMEKLGATLKQHLVEMFNGVFDQAYVEKRKKIANVHHRINLPIKWYIASFQNLQSSLIDIIHETVGDRESIRQFTKAVEKLLHFEMQFVLDTISDHKNTDSDSEYVKMKEELKDSISSVSEEVAALSEETSSSVEQLVQSSQDVNQNVQNCTEKSHATKKVAETGMEKMQSLQKQIRSITESTTYMKETILKLNESSEKIQKVVNMVQDIAEQTNLLALNSAIEAARAGEHGKGFAVVADEVRKLADQTKTSVSEIGTLINQSNSFTFEVVDAIQEVQTMVENGEKESNETNESFNLITSSVDETLEEIQYVNDRMRELVSIIEEIGSATEKVSASAENLDETVKQL